MHEIVASIHMHSRYSDGTGTHAEIAAAAQQVGLDAIIVTDHNVLVKGLEGYYEDADSRVLLLTGEEVHDQARQPQKNHMLVLGAGAEVAHFAGDPQELVDRVQALGGLSFLAHPFDQDMPLVQGPDISWVNWDLKGYTGIELWNGLTEFKGRFSNWPEAIFYAYWPRLIANGPDPRTLRKWDELLNSGRRVAAIGGPDAHALAARKGPFRRTIFPYEFHFRTLNTHILLDEPLTGDLGTDKVAIYRGLGAGHAYVGYDLPMPTRGFRFWAKSGGEQVVMGDELVLDGEARIRAHFPVCADIRLLRNGELVQGYPRHDALNLDIDEPGVYRVEAYRKYLGRSRAWIFSNPIYVREGKSRQVHK